MFKLIGPLLFTRGETLTKEELSTSVAQGSDKQNS